MNEIICMMLAAFACMATVQAAIAIINLAYWLTYRKGK